jgi:SAM-dependent methyltransferase
MRMSQKEARENHARLLARDASFRQFGYDAQRNTDFVLSQALPLPGRILEVGTGKGRFLTALLAHVPLVTTIDVDPAEQHCARLNVSYAKPPGRARFVIADAARLPWRVCSFDSVVSVNALHHIEDWLGVVDEVIRVTRPAGRIVLADFSERGFAIMDRIQRQEGHVHEHKPYRFHDLIKRFAENGWRATLRTDDCQEVLIAVGPSAGDGRRRPQASGLKSTSPTFTARVGRIHEKGGKASRRNRGN